MADSNDLSTRLDNNELSVASNLNRIIANEAEISKSVSEMIFRTSTNHQNSVNLYRFNEEFEKELNNNTDNLTFLSKDIKGLKLKVTDNEIETEHLQDNYMNNLNRIDHLDEVLQDKERSIEENKVKIESSEE